MFEVGSLVFENWRICGRLGQGGYGCVYALEREDFGITSRSAMKVISVPGSEAELKALLDSAANQEEVEILLESRVRQLVEEFSIMEKLKATEHIVSIEDHAVIPKNPGPGWDILIRMELLTPFPQYRRERELTKQDVIRLGIDICKALELCQSYRILHRDIKPANIMVTERGAFKLGDFGVARTLHDGAAELTQSGTPNYMAPEVYRNKPYDYRADIYSLGIVMYWLLNRCCLPFSPLPPVTKTQANQEEALNRRMGGEAIPMPADDQGALAEIVRKACAYAPELRFEDTAQMRRALEALPQDYGKNLEPTQVGNPAAATASRPEKSSSRPKGKGLVLIALLLALGLGAGLLARGQVVKKQASYSQLMTQALESRESDPEKALELYRSAHTLYPQEESPVISYAYTLYEMGQLQECVAYIENDLAMGENLSDSGQNQLREILGAAWFDQGEYAKAAEAFRSAALEQGLTESAMRDFAVCLGRLGEYQAADEMMERMVNAGASDSVLTYIQAEIDLALESYALAEEGFLEVLEDAGDLDLQRRALRSLAQLYQTCTALDKVGTSPIAQPARKSATLLEQKMNGLHLQYDVPLLEMLGEAWYETYQAEADASCLEKSQKAFSQALALVGSQKHLYTNLFVVYSAMDAEDDAERILEEFAEAYPRDYTPYALRAILLIRQGDDTAAREAAEEAQQRLRTDDDQTYYQMMLSLLEEVSAE